MTILHALALTAITLSPQGPSSAPVVINEFTYHDATAFWGMDDEHEMVELYNRSAAPVDISNWELENSNGGYMRMGSIPAGTILQPGGYYVMGGILVPDPKQELLSYWFSPGQPRNLFLDSSAALLIKDSTGAIIDSVHYETHSGLWAGAAPEGQGIWGRGITHGGSLFSWQRAIDGLDSDNNGYDFVFLPWTPGGENKPSGWFPHANNYDGLAEETVVSEWGQTQDNVWAIDPTVGTSLHNTGSIPPSPQGGIAATFYPDPEGSNDVAGATVLLSSVPADAVFEAWVYFDGIWKLAGHETWSIGFGSTDSDYVAPNPGGRPWWPNKNGNQGGVSWTYQVTDDEAALYLIDHNDGGWGISALTPEKVIGKITIIPGVNDGWQKLRLERNGNMVLGSFGGTIGCADGTSFWADLDHSGPTTLYVGYRETVPNNSQLRPPTWDDLIVNHAQSSVTWFGNGAPTSVGTPQIATMGPPSIGHQGWGIRLSGLMPSQVSVLFLGSRAVTPFPLESIGGQPGSMLEVTPLLALPIGSDSTGAAALPIRLPCSLPWIGVPMSWQAFDPDPSLPYALPFGNSAGMETTFGL